MTPKLIPFYKISLSDYRGGERPPEEVMATRATDSTVWLYRGLDPKGEVIESRGMRRITTWEGYYPTLGEAIAASRELLGRRIDGLIKDIAIAQKELADARVADERFRRQQESGHGKIIAWSDPGKMPRKIKV